MKAIICANAADDEVVDGVVLSTLRPEILRIIFLCLDMALFLTWIWIMYLLVTHRNFPLFGLPILLLRFLWFAPAQKVWKELGLGEDGVPERKKKHTRRQ